MKARSYAKMKPALRKRYIEIFQNIPTEMEVFKMTLLATKLNKLTKEGAA